MKVIPPIMIGNFGKWKKEFSNKQIKEIGPILTPKLMELSYENDENWYKRGYSKL
jgi:hypothetical protein